MSPISVPSAVIQRRPASRSPSSSPSSATSSAPRAMVGGWIDGRQHDVVGVRRPTGLAGQRSGVALLPRPAEFAGGRAVEASNEAARITRSPRLPARTETGAGVRRVPRWDVRSDAHPPRRDTDRDSPARNAPLRVPHPSLDADHRRGLLNRADDRGAPAPRSSGRRRRRRDASHPYAGDAHPGQTTGQGSKAFGAGWYVLRPTGKKIDND